MNTTSRFLLVTVLSPALAVGAHLLLPSIPAELAASAGSLAQSVATSNAPTSVGAVRIAGSDDGINPQPLPPRRRS